MTEKFLGTEVHEFSAQKILSRDKNPWGRVNLFGVVHLRKKWKPTNKIGRKE